MGRLSIVSIVLKVPKVLKVLKASKVLKVREEGGQGFNSLKVSTVSIIAVVGGTWPNLSPPPCRPSPPWLWPCPALATHSDLPFPARALPFHPDGLSGSVAAPRCTLWGNSVICSFLSAVVFPCQFSDFPSDSLSSLAGPPCCPFKIPLVSLKWSRCPLPFPLNRH